MALVSAENMTAQAHGFGTLPPIKQVLLLGAVALTIALGITVAMWSQTPNYKALASSENPTSMLEITKALEGGYIPYKVEDGMIMVPIEQYEQARMKVAGQGVAVDGGSNADSIIYGDQGIGTSDKILRERILRAKESEIAKSISRLVVVQSARVHIAMPKKSAFARKHSQPAVSVVLHVQPGRVLDDSQVAGIVNMVASSIPELDAEHVTVIDQKGRLLSQNSDPDMMMTSNHFNYSRRVEDEYVRRIIEIISPIVGRDGMQAKVNAEIDFTAYEQTTETYLPEDLAIRSETGYTETRLDGTVGGVPGALTNQPPNAGALEAQGEEQATGGGLTTSQSTTNYEVGKTLSHTRPSSVRLEKLSVAVVLDYTTAVNEEGVTTQVPLEAETIERITELVREAVGLDEARGDTISIVNAPFKAAEVFEPLPEPPIWEQPWVLNLVKQIIGGIGVLIIIFGVLKPTLRNLSTNRELVEKLASDEKDEVPEATPAGGAANPDQLALGEGQTGEAGEGGGAGVQGQGGSEMVEKSTEQQLIELASTMAKEDPKRVAQVMTTWVEEDE